MDFANLDSIVLGVAMGALAFWLMWRENTQLRAENKTLREKADTMLYEIADLKEQLGFERGAWDADAVKARSERAAENIRTQPLPNADNKRGGRNDKKQT